MLPQAYLGIAFGFGIPMAFAAQTNELPATAWSLLAANVFWAIAYDTEYAMVDRDDDVKLGIRTSAILFGRYDVAAVMICYAAMLAVLVWVGMYEKLALALLCRARGGRCHDGLPLHADPRPHARGLLQGVPPQQLGRGGDLRRHRGGLRARRGAWPRWDFATGNP